jgi:Uma2 family endonuclease
MQDMPLMIAEVLSFRQFQSSLIKKFEAYFALGVKSCWLVDPVTRSIHVFSSINDWQTFSIEDELKDENFGIRFPVAEVFSD